VRCSPSSFTDNYGAWLDRKSVCYDPSASLIVRVTVSACGRKCVAHSPALHGSKASHAQLPTPHHCSQCTANVRRTPVSGLVGCKDRHGVHACVPKCFLAYLLALRLKRITPPFCKLTHCRPLHVRRQRVQVRAVGPGLHDTLGSGTASAVAHLPLPPLLHALLSPTATGGGAAVTGRI
jgi:hypothetical protein